ncbi:MAG: hypothetical protein IKG46_07885 [Solobacterium sp.]|nr:hypothetical protein [Solobacterium sp.]
METDSKDFAFDILAELEKIEESDKAYLQKKIAEAEQNGKEPFDFEYLKRHYHRRGLLRSDSWEYAAQDLNDLIDSYQKEYYISFPEIRTMKEFVRKLEEMDTFE